MFSLQAEIRNARCLQFVEHREIKGIDPEDAITLLLRAAQIDEITDPTQRDHARPIARTLAYLPLALIQAGASISQNVCSLEDYLDVYRSHRKEIMSSQGMQCSDNYKYTVYST